MSATATGKPPMFRVHSITSRVVPAQLRVHVLVYFVRNRNNHNIPVHVLWCTSTSTSSMLILHRVRAFPTRIDMCDASNERADAHEYQGVQCTVPGMGETMAAGRSTSAFRREDLPAFGRPRIAHCTPARRRSPRRASLRSACNARTSTSTTSVTSREEYTSQAADTRNQLFTNYCTMYLYMHAYCIM